MERANAKREPQPRIAGAPRTGGAVLIDQSPRGERFAALRQLVAQGPAAPAQRRLSMLEVSKIGGKSSAIYKLMIGDSLYAQVIEGLTTAAEVHELFGELRGLLPGHWAYANADGIKLGKPLEKLRLAETKTLADTVQKAIAKRTGGGGSASASASAVSTTTTASSSTSSPPMILSSASVPAPFLVGASSASTSASVISSAPLSWEQATSGVLSKSSKPSGFSAAAATAAEPTSEETSEIRVTANTADGRLEVVLHYHPSETGNFLHFKLTRDATENVQVGWSHWLLAACGITKASFARS